MCVHHIPGFLRGVVRSAVAERVLRGRLPGQPPRQVAPRPNLASAE